jgi:hypothetical protein
MSHCRSCGCTVCEPGLCGECLLRRLNAMAREAGVSGSESYLSYVAATGRNPPEFQRSGRRPWELEE